MAEYGYVDKSLFENDAAKKAERLKHLEERVQVTKRWLEDHKRLLKRLDNEISRLKRRIKGLGKDPDELDLAEYPKPGGNAELNSLCQRLEPLVFRYENIKKRERDPEVVAEEIEQMEVEMADLREYLSKFVVVSYEEGKG